MPSASASSEPVARSSASMPYGYVFVRKGNVYMTLNCRRQTHAAHKTVYQVIDDNKKTLGIRVPRFVYDQVCSSEAATRQDRSAAVQKRDTALEKEFRDAVLKFYPKTPGESVTKIVSHAMRKNSGRVGRCGKLAVGSKAIMGVRAHIRHCHTDYDKLMRSGVKREAAREKTLAKIDQIAKAWGGQPGLGGGPKKVVKKPQRGGVTKPTRKNTVDRPRRRNLRSKKLGIRHARTVTATPAAVQPAQKLCGRSLLQDSADDESDEFAWADSEEDDDSEWTLE